MAKLIFILYSWFLICFNVLANDSTEEATMGVKLTLLEPINIVCGNMDFGTVVSGLSYDSIAPVTIKSKGYKRLGISVDSQTKTSNGIFLLGPKGSKPLEVVLNSVGEYSTRNNIYELENAAIMSPYNGILNLKIKGTLNVPRDQKAGTYSGIVTFKVRYD